MSDEDKPSRQQPPYTPEQHARWRAAVEANSKWLPGSPLAKQLTALWGQDNPRLSAAAIGQKLRTTKSAIVGAVHRLGLPARPSPILWGVTPEAPKPLRVGRGTTLPPLATACAATPSVSVRYAAIMEREQARCCWPIGTPGEAGFRMCDEAPAALGKPYCAEHAARAYAKPEPKQPSTLREVEQYAAEHRIAPVPASGLVGLVVAVNNHRRKRGLTPYQLAKEPAHG